MDDLEMTLLCAKAMGLEIRYGLALPLIVMPPDSATIEYHPLVLDAQCFALVKHIGLDMGSPVREGGEWIVSVSRRSTDSRTGWEMIASMDDADLNRAIVTCVARMQAALAKGREA